MGRYQLADDYVFLEPDQLVHLAVNGGLGQDPGGLLEGSGRQPAIGAQRGPGDAQQHGVGRGRLAALRQHLGVNVLVEEPVNQLFRHQLGVPGGINADLGQHLVDDGFNMLVVYGHALGAVDLLHLVDQVLLDGLPAQNAQYVLRVDRPIGKLLPGFYLVLGLDPDAGGAG